MGVLQVCCSVGDVDPLLIGMLHDLSDFVLKGVVKGLAFAARSLACPVQPEVLHPGFVAKGGANLQHIRTGTALQGSDGV